MSMFHELMMRKKEEIMYATIKGTLTENDGVFSGFSSSNYLQIDNVLQETEFVVKFTTSSDITSRQFVISSTRLIEITVWDSYIKTYNFQSRQAVSLCSIQANTTYWVKEKITSTTKTFSISTDGINYGNDITLNDNYGTGTNTIRFGTYVRNLDYNFLGSIDLNKSYIKLGSTKYNLQAVVGYTIVGSPTIVDGVVSGFSSSDYLKISKASGDINTIKAIIKIGNLPTTVSDNGLIVSFLGNLNLRLYTTSSKLLRVYFINEEGTSTYLGVGSTLSSNYIKLIVDKNEGVSFYLSNDGTNWTLGNTTSTKPKMTNAFSTVRFGYETSIFASLPTSIDMNETWIKINNKLWFNGQEG